MNDDLSRYVDKSYKNNHYYDYMLPFSMHFCINIAMIITNAMHASERLHYLTKLVERHAHVEGINRTSVESLGLYKVTQTTARCPSIDDAGIGLVCQGMKRSHFGERQLEYIPGKVMIGFYPIPVETEVIQATVDEPFLLVGLAIDHRRMANILSRLDQIEDAIPRSFSADPTNLFAMPLNKNLLNPFIRLVELLDNPIDVAMLSDNIIDEIYYRIVSQERGGELRALLQQHGDIQSISKAIAYIHQNLNQSVSVDRLVEIVHMSRTAFFKNFKAVMHMSPFQYIKKVKLNEAQRLIRAGKRVNEAGYLVGYGRPAQFSREYKQYFGYPPSATRPTSLASDVRSD